MQKKLVLFDIDGTLLMGGHWRTRGRFEHAFKKVYGIEQTIEWDRHDGAVDRQIVIYEMTKAGLTVPQIEERIEELFAEMYHFFLQNMGGDYRENLFAPAAALARRLHSRVYLGLLTGNYEDVGRLKVESVGLKKYFQFGVFGHVAQNRIALAKLVPERAKKHFGFAFKPDHIFVIGDTPNDVVCGKAIGAKTIAVATGRSTKEQLNAAGADLVVDSLGERSVYAFINE